MGTASGMSLSRCSPRSVISTVDEQACLARENDLAAVRSGRDARSEVNVVADVALLADVGFAGVQTDAYADRPRAQGFNTLAGGVHCPGRRREGVEEGISLRIHLDAAVALKCHPQSAAVVIRASS